MVVRIISGGQTGVDRGALDAALEAGIAIGGYCPKGRLAEDGVIPPRFPLVEITASSYPARTRANIMNSGGTLILVRTAEDLSGGTRLTEDLCRSYAHPCLVLCLCEGPTLAARWIKDHSIRVLNVAGPRESKAPGIEAATKVFVIDLLRQLRETAHA